MNRIDEHLNRLFRAADRKAAPDAVAPPYGLETRAMAAWREGRTAEPGFWTTAILVRGLILALVIMGVSFWPVLTTTSDSSQDYVADTTVLTDEVP
jgi:hypothetical protein